jgi:hypothetical protein
MWTWLETAIGPSKISDEAGTEIGSGWGLFHWGRESSISRKSWNDSLLCRALYNFRILGRWQCVTSDKAWTMKEMNKRNKFRN